MKKTYVHNVTCSEGCQTITKQFDEFTEYQTHAIGCNGEFTLTRDGIESSQLAIYDADESEILGFTILSKSADSSVETRIKTSLRSHNLIETGEYINFEELSDRKMEITCDSGIFVLIVM